MALDRRPAVALPRLAPDSAAALRLAWRATWMTRALVWAAGLGAVAIWGVPARSHDFDPVGLTSPFGSLGDALVAPAARWDSVWYLAIAGDGYGHPGRPAFFPVYPLLVRLWPSRVWPCLFGSRPITLGVQEPRAGSFRKSRSGTPSLNTRTVSSLRFKTEAALQLRRHWVA